MNLDPALWAVIMGPILATIGLIKVWAFFKKVAG